MLNFLIFFEIFEFSDEKFRKIPILKEFEWFEWFEWFGPSPIEPFNSDEVHSGPDGDGPDRRRPRSAGAGRRPDRMPDFWDEEVRRATRGLLTALNFAKIRKQFFGNFLMKN